uniref:C2H2-type domain-containing protein n=1 Tax=Pieris brassicae TaxID=7116 RepID=A0A2Z5U7C2_PIEBR|nr:hypothetical protein [Pieris brassicae]
MCWECCAVLRKVEEFKKQIIKAQKCMLDLVSLYMFLFAIIISIIYYVNSIVDEKIVKTLEEFDESDEEPLRNKKIKTKEKIKKESEREKASGVVINSRVMKKLQQLNVNSDHLEMVESERQATLQNPKFVRHAHKCHQCALGFNHACKLDEHMKKHQPSVGSVECDSCHIQCKDKQALASHRRRHRVR